MMGEHHVRKLVLFLELFAETGKMQGRINLSPNLCLFCSLGGNWHVICNIHRMTGLMSEAGQGQLVIALPHLCQALFWNTSSPSTTACAMPSAGFRACLWHGRGSPLAVVPRGLVAFYQSGEHSSESQVTNIYFPYFKLDLSLLEKMKRDSMYISKHSK